MKTASAVSDTQSATVTRWDQIPKASQGLTIRVEKHTPTAKLAVAVIFSR
jgi:hypothetical protein